MKIFLRFFAWLLSFKISGRLKEIDQKEKIVCLYGHNPTKMALEELIKWFLKNNFNFITTETLIDIVNKQRKVKRPIWLSFDDGWRDNFSNVLPTLERRKIPATFFISTKPIETGTFWWTKAFRNMDQLRVNNINYLFDIPNTDRKKQIDQISESSNKRDALTIEELKSLAKSKYVTIGNHTDDHVNCLTCSKHELIEEIEIANNKIKTWIGIAPKYFAYPGGYRNRNIIQLIKHLNFELGASIEPRLADSKDDIYNFPRTFFKKSPVSLPENIVMALGIRQKYVTLLRNLYDRMFVR